jgi:hypothetical protein
VAAVVGRAVGGAKTLMDEREGGDERGVGRCMSNRARAHIRDVPLEAAAGGTCTKLTQEESGL